MPRNEVDEFSGLAMLRCLLLLLPLSLLAPVSSALASAETAPVQAESAAPPDGALREELRRTVGWARDQVFPALVSIQGVTVQHRGGKELKGPVVGSGTIISAAGHVLTNEHVTHNGRQFILTLSDRRQAPAVLVGEDALTDLAVLKLDLSELPGEPLPFARFGDSAKLEIGDYVMAMGSPFSLSRSVSLGIVSNTERVFAGGFGQDDIEGLEFDGQRTGLFTRWIQHDALISPGNSGGPLVNLMGEIVGVNELGGGNLSFAIPSNLAARISRQLIADGEIERSWLGMSFRPTRGSGFDRGALISSVVVGGPAVLAGVKAGDLLVRAGDQPVNVQFVEEVPVLMDRLASLPVGSQLALELQRGDENLQVVLATERLGRDLGEAVSLQAWGISVRGITPRMARERGLEDHLGVLVIGVRSGGPSQQAEPALRRGDRLRSIDGRAIQGLGELIEMYTELTDPLQEPKDLLFEFDRRGANHMSLIAPQVDSFNDPPRELPKAWIGVTTQPLFTPLAESLGLDGERGFRITRVYPGSEAAAAELQVGDVVLAVDGEALRPASMGDSALLSRRVRSLDIGQVVELAIARGDQRMALPVTLERTRLTPEQARRHTDRDFELAVRELTFFDRDENRWPADIRGVIVENAESGGWAALGGLQPGDLIRSFGGFEIRSLEGFRKTLSAIKRERQEQVVVVLARGAKDHYLHLEPDWKPVDLEDR